jgi:hypothetical protein
MIHVHNLRDGAPPENIKHQRIHRGTPLGNPFEMKDKSEQERQRVITAYKRLLDESMTKRNGQIYNELVKLRSIYSATKELHLYCFCAPKACHGDLVAHVLNNWPSHKASCARCNLDVQGLCQEDRNNVAWHIASGGSPDSCTHREDD